MTQPTPIAPIGSASKDLHALASSVAFVKTAITKAYVSFATKTLRAPNSFVSFAVKTTFSASPSAPKVSSPVITTITKAFTNDASTPVIIVNSVNLSLLAVSWFVALLFEEGDVPPKAGKPDSTGKPVTPGKLTNHVSSTIGSGITPVTSLAETPIVLSILSNHASFSPDVCEFGATDPPVFCDPSMCNSTVVIPHVSPPMNLPTFYAP